MVILAVNKKPLLYPIALIIGLIKRYCVPTTVIKDLDREVTILISGKGKSEKNKIIKLPIKPFK
ncbi:MAG: hypothetical protein J6Y78_04020 [Paludibacteraceae bacterium]|nr:hypothetical protein [Paludibacteraceae bacterium]